MLAFIDASEAVGVASVLQVKWPTTKLAAAQVEGSDVSVMLLCRRTLVGTNGRSPSAPLPTVTCFVCQEENTPMLVALFFTEGPCIEREHWCLLQVCGEGRERVSERCDNCVCNTSWSRAVVDT